MVPFSLERVEKFLCFYPVDFARRNSKLTLVFYHWVALTGRNIGKSPPNFKYKMNYSYSRKLAVPALLLKKKKTKTIVLSCGTNKTNESKQHLKWISEILSKFHTSSERRIKTHGEQNTRQNISNPFVPSYDNQQILNAVIFNLENF